MTSAREICLALATVCENCREWDGARTLRHAAEYLYKQKFWSAEKLPPSLEVR